MKKLITLSAILLVYQLVLGQVTYVMHYLPTLPPAKVASYKGYDMIVVDHEVIHNSPDGLRQMRRDNPDLKIIAYANLIEWHNPMFPDKPWSKEMVRILKQYPDWFMRGTDGKNLEFWPGTILMNCRLDCPRHIINGRSYNYVEFFAERYLKDIIGEYKRQGIHLDGMLADELLPSINFIGHYNNNTSGTDSDGDGLDDDPAELDRQWRLGNAYFLEVIRDAMGDDFIIIGNGGNGYYMKSASGKTLCNFKQLENFPDIYLNETDKTYEAWFESMKNAAGMEMALFNARPDNLMYTFYSGMLLDNVIFSQGQNTPYNKKYELHLGEALGRWYEENGIYMRKYQNGTVCVDPLKKIGWIER